MRPAPDRRRAAPSPPRRTAWASWSPPRSTPGRPGSCSGSAAAAPTTAARGCSRRSAPPPTGRSTQGVGRAGGHHRRSSCRPFDIELVAATDVDNPLTGLFGATKVFGPQKGIPEERLPVVDGWLEELAAATDRRVALAEGAGAAGGLGFALLLLGGTREPGIGLVAEARRGSPSGPAQADLVITGEGAFDYSSRGGKVPYGVAEIAGEALRPCVVLAGQVHVGSREMRALGVESAYSLVEAAGEERAFADPAGALADLAERVARTWSRASPGNNRPCATIGPSN